MKAKNDDLLRAAATGNITLMRTLLAEGADIECCNDNNQRPLHLAAKHGHTEAVRILLGHGAEVNSRDIGKNICLSWLANYMGIGFGQTPLYLAIENHHINTVKLLLAHGANLTSIVDNAVIMRTAFSGQSEILAALLNTIPNIHPQIASEILLASISKTAKEFAATFLPPTEVPDLTEVAKVIIQHPSTFQATKDNHTKILLAAIKEKSIQLVQEIIKAKPCIDFNTYHFLHQAAYVDSPEIIEILLEAGMNIEAVDKKNTTALDITKLYERFDAMKALLKAGAKVHTYDWGVLLFDDLMPEFEPDYLPRQQAAMFHVIPTYLTQRLINSVKAGTYNLSTLTFLPKQDHEIKIEGGKISAYKKLSSPTPKKILEGIPCEKVFESECARAQFKHAIKEGVSVDRLLAFIEAIESVAPGILMVKGEILENRQCITQHLEALDSIFFIGSNLLESPMPRADFLNIMKVLDSTAPYPPDTEAGKQKLAAAKADGTYLPTIVQYLFTHPGHLDSIKYDLGRYWYYPTLEQKEFLFDLIAQIITAEATTAASSLVQFAVAPSLSPSELAAAAADPNIDIDAIMATSPQETQDGSTGCIIC
jgi:ankyrin repeat protein